MKLSEFKIEDFVIEEEVPFEQGCDKSPIAIIGMAGQVGNVKNLEDFWRGLLEGQTFQHSMGSKRKEDLHVYLKAKNGAHLFREKEIASGSMMEDISEFDPLFFNISKQEALYMDPQQRLFMKMAWEALEDAGYAGEAIKGTQTGIFVGLATNFSEEYAQIVRTLNPDAPEVAVVGNMKSIIPGRMSHFLDVHGPSLLMDTACSSGLTALYTAMRSLQNGDCSMAIVGGVKCEMVPIDDHYQQGVGMRELDHISSPDGLTRTFDESSAGTGHAEGGVVFILKPLTQALKDKDHVLCTLVGGAMNHDGDANGLTAPNPQAQEALILDALKDANVEAEKISYIEAHGTATKLGDPIEIKGITKAFRQLTSKKQSIAIGSVKSNVGHMDNVSGLIGVAKLVKAMKHHLLPASLHFFEPNHNIDFINAPVYVNANRTQWSKEGKTVYAGINSFGLSGTNCHLILQSFEKKEQVETREGSGLFTLSHQSKEGLYKLASHYLAFIQKSTVNVYDCAYTAYVGRRHLETRLAIVFKNKEDLCGKIRQFVMNHWEETDRIFVGEHKMAIHLPKITDGIHYTTPAHLEMMNDGAKKDVAAFTQENGDQILEKLAKIYIKGGKIPIQAFTYERDVKRISLPTYHFSNERYWVKADPAVASQNKPLFSHQKSVQTKDFTIYHHDIVARNHWEIYEHQINDVYVMPGTSYVNAVIHICFNEKERGFPLKMSNVVFHSPFYLKEEDTKTLQLMISHQAKEKTFTFVSHLNNEWHEHASGTIQNETGPHQERERVDLNELKKEIQMPITFDDHQEVHKGLHLGQHWKNCILTGHQNEAADCFLIEVRFKDKGKDGNQGDYFHPSLTDIAINALNGFLADDTLYLPLSYGELIMYNAINDHLFVYMRQVKSDSDAKIICFDMDIYDHHGQKLAKIDHYTIKEMDRDKFKAKKEEDVFGYETVYQVYDEPFEVIASQETVLFIYGDDDSKQCLNNVRQYLNATRIDEMDLRNFDANAWVLSLKKKQVSSMIYAYSPLEVPSMYDPAYSSQIEQRLKQSYDLLKVMIEAHGIPKNEIIVLVNRVQSNGSVKSAPDYAAIAGLWKVAMKEYESSKMRLIEYDNQTNHHVLAKEIMALARARHVIYQRDTSLIETVKAINPSLKAEVAKFKNLPDSQIEGVYVLTGGTGDLALETAELLVQKGVKNLVLLTRGTFLPTHQWRDRIATESDLGLVEKLKKLCKLNEALTHLEVISVDLDDYQRLEKVMAYLKGKYSNIQGVMHLAGQAGQGYLLNKEWSTFMDVFKAKAITFMNLHYALLPYHVHYFVAFSSMSSAVIEVGQSDYTAANLFLDEWTQYRRQENLAGFSIQWPAWRETGMAKRMKAVDENDYFQPLKTAEALSLLDDIVFSGKDYPAVLIPGKKQAYKKSASEKNVKTLVNVKVTGMENPDHHIKRVAQIWSDILGLDEVHVDDEFSALGGNSLFISKMLAEYENYYPGLMDMVSLFTYTTVAKQAEYLQTFDEEKLENDHEHVEEATDLAHILDQLVSGVIDVEESIKLIK